MDALHDCVRIATGVLSTIAINEEKMMKVRVCVRVRVFVGNADGCNRY